MSRLLEDLRRRLEKRARGRTLIVLLLITWSLYSLMMFYTIPLVMDYAHGMKLLDMQPLGYNVDYARTLMTQLGEEGRHAYLFRQLPIDMIYPFCFALTYSLLLVYLFRRGFREGNFICHFFAVPVLGGAFDYLENLGEITMLVSYPDFPDWLIRLTGAFSILKSFFTTIFFVLLVIGLIAAGVRRYRPIAS
jgi:hypothetical protein